MQNQFLEILPSECNYSNEFLAQKANAIKAGLGNNERVYFSDEPVLNNVLYVIKQSTAGMPEDKSPKRPAKLTPSGQAMRAARKEETRKFTRQEEDYRKRKLIKQEAFRQKRNRERQAAKERKDKKKADMLAQKQAKQVLQAKPNTGVLTDAAIGRGFTAKPGPPDQDGFVSVQVDNKTWILISADRDPEEAVAKYRARHHK